MLYHIGEIQEDGNCKAIPINGSPVVIKSHPDIGFFLHHSPGEPHDCYKWSVSEEATGRYIVKGRTKKDTIEQAIEYLKDITHEQMGEHINKYRLVKEGD